MGIDTVLAASQEDMSSLAAREAQEVHCIGGQTARESYLDRGKIIEAAKSAGCQAIHPGYGFLSEDAEFAQAVLDAGLIFVGPSAASIRALGVKTSARQTVSAAGVPITEGSEGATTDEEIISAAVTIGFPVIIKAAAGGGGRGMRIVRAEHEMKESLERARAEAVKNFGSPVVYCEKFVEEPRHVEVQLFGDQHGNVVHFGTRDCSAQRRHQKLVEEAPAPFLDHDIREAIHNAAVTAAKSVGYYNAGTAEFLVKGREFYFLEINTRIQVEHPVTEAITGIDLVQLQLRVAMGEKLPCAQEEVRFRGHAIELRINAEDVSENFRPAVGQITSWKKPLNTDIREESGYAEGDAVSPFYDSLISKVIAHGETRADALYKAFQYLKHYKIGGLPTSLPFHAWILSLPRFQRDGIDIGFVERTFSAEAAKEAQKLLWIDPAHCSSERTVNTQAETIYLHDGAGTPCPVHILHEHGGTFLGIPLSPTGAPFAKEFWRRSNIREEVVRSIQAQLQAGSQK
jgi:acetyl/propionyl-CoA carboxylase alpha subunit